MITLLTGLEACDAFEYLRKDADLPVGKVTGLMQRAWLRGEARHGDLVVVVRSINSDGAENATYEIGIRLP